MGAQDPDNKLIEGTEGQEGAEGNEPETFDYQSNRHCAKT